VTGARQTGKTTLLREAFPDHHYVSLDLPSLAEQAEREPTRFLAEHASPALIDEVQYAPGLLRHLKHFVEAKWTEHADIDDARTITALDAELRASGLRTRPGKHAILCRTPHAYPIDERTTALPHTQLDDLLAPPNA
jgi:hypothetical protein